MRGAFIAEIIIHRMVNFERRRSARRLHDRAVAGALGRSRTCGRRHPGARRRRQDGPDAGALGQAGGARQAGHRRGALLRTLRELRSRARRRMHRLRPARPRGAGAAAEHPRRRAQSGVHGRPQVRCGRQRVADLDDERRRADDGGRDLPRDCARWSSPPPASTPTCRWTVRARTSSAEHAAGRRLRQLAASAASACSSTFRASTARRVGWCACRTPSTCATACCYDVASTVFAGQPLDLTMGYADVIWQGDANEQALRLLAHCTTPTSPINVTRAAPDVGALACRASSAGASAAAGVQRPGGADGLAARHRASAGAVRRAARADRIDDRLGGRLGRTQGGPSLGKPTHFSTRDGKY